jgi:DNA-binding transcriptional LysR family regulator
MVSIQPIEEFLYFARVVQHGGYAKAARALGIPKSRLSRHVAALESRLNVRLLQRSTRRFAVTEIGQEVYRHALAMLAEADAAVEAVEFARAEPRGVIKISCPVAMAQTWLAALLPDFLGKYPAVRLQLHVSNRRLDRVGRPSEPGEIAARATLDYAAESDRQTWELRGPQDKTVRLEHSPRLACHDFVMLRNAALAGLGIARLPENVVSDDLKHGALERVLPQWNTPQGTVHLVFPTRRGLLPAVRALIDFLAERFQKLL